MGIIVVLIFLIAVFYIGMRISDEEKDAAEKEKRAKEERAKEERKRSLAEAEKRKKEEEKKLYEETSAKLKNTDLYIKVKSKIYEIATSHINEIKDTFVAENNEDLLAVTINSSEIKIVSYNGKKISCNYKYYYDEDDRNYYSTDTIDKLIYDENALIDEYEYRFNKEGYSNLDSVSIKAFYAVLNEDLEKLLAESSAEISLFDYDYSQANLAYLFYNRTLQINFNNCYRQVKPLF